MWNYFRLDYNRLKMNQIVLEKRSIYV